VDVSFRRGRIGAQLLSGENGRLFGQRHNPLVDLLERLAKERESSTQIAVIWNRVLIKRVKRR
jgi:hypothetical protein